MIGLVDYTLLIAAILPVITILQIMWLWRNTRKPLYLVFVFPMIYMAAYYILYIINLHTWHYHAERFQLWFRLMVIVNAGSIITYLASEIAVVLHKKRHE